MKPPVCAVCDKELDLNDGGLIYFKKRPSDWRWHKKIKKSGFTGHPPYAEWFCSLHYKQAKQIMHYTIDKALTILKRNKK